MRRTGSLIIRTPVVRGSKAREGKVRRLLEATGRVVGQAKRFATEIADGVKRAADTDQLAVRGASRIAKLVNGVGVSKPA